MTLYSTYTDPITYKRAPTGQEVGTLVGNLLRLTAGISVGATSLPVPPLTVVLNVDDQVTIFDGSSSEVVMVTASAAIGATSIAITATEAAHAAKTVICSDGIMGSLSEAIIEASSWLETITQQPRWMTTYTETLQAPSMRAAVDRNLGLIMRPRRFPLGTVTTLSYQTQIGNVVNLDATQCIIDSQVQTIAIPAINMTGGYQSVFARMPLGRTSPVWISITYSAGYTPLPGYIIEAANCLTGALLSDRYNPTGSAETQMGKQHIVAYLRGDQTAKSALIKRAESLLRSDIERVM